MFFEDEIDIKIYEREPILKELADEKYVEHRNQLAEEIKENFSDKIRSIEIFPNESDDETYSFNGVEFIGIEIVVNMNKVQKASDDEWIII